MAYDKFPKIDEKALIADLKKHKAYLKEYYNFVLNVEQILEDFKALKFEDPAQLEEVDWEGLTDYLSNAFNYAHQYHEEHKNWLSDLIQDMQIYYLKSIILEIEKKFNRDFSFYQLDIDPDLELYISDLSMEELINQLKQHIKEVKHKKLTSQLTIPLQKSIEYFELFDKVLDESSARYAFHN